MKTRQIERVVDGVSIVYASKKNERATFPL